MNARVVPPARGVAWLAEGWRMFRAAPFGWLVLVFTYLMGTMLVSALPLVGPLGIALLVPAISVGFMAASRAAWRRQPVELAMLAAGFRERLSAQLVLGAVYAAGFVFAIYGSALADGGALLQALQRSGAAAGEPASTGAVSTGLLFSVLLYLPTMMLLWFSPVLVAWHSLAPAKALFYSAVAFWLNLRAFLAYGIALAALLFVLVGALTLLVAALPGEVSAASVQSLIFPLALVVLPILFASYYASYRDVFGVAEAA
jgi:hypothetical protein